MANVFLLSDAEHELEQLSTSEEVAVRTVMAKLEAMGSKLGFPHQSAIRGVENLREMRPRSGRSPTRAFYSQTGAEQFHVCAIGPEASVDPRGFNRSVRQAKQRLNDFEKSGDET